MRRYKSLSKSAPTWVGSRSDDPRLGGALGANAAGGWGLRVAAVAGCGAADLFAG